MLDTVGGSIFVDGGEAASVELTVSVGGISVSGFVSLFSVGLAG